MPKLILKFEERELQECAVGTHPVSIGRLPDNNVVIDNPAVSGRHARVYREGNHYVLEDLKSTNGTFVNGQRPGGRGPRAARAVDRACVWGSHRAVV